MTVAVLPSSKSISGANAEFERGLTIAQLVIDLTVELLAARGAAFVACAGSSLRLVASHGLTQGALEYMKQTWQDDRGGLEAGMTSYGPEGEEFFVAPCIDAGTVRGLLYVETSRRPFSDELATLAGILTRALRRMEGRSTGDDELPEGPPDRQEMVALLERNEWNLSRVARILGVTRMTIYNRLKRLNIPRQRMRRPQGHSRANA